MPIATSDLVTIGLLVALEGLLSADNALVMAIMVLGLPGHDRRKALRYGLLGGFAFRIAATLLAVAGLVMVSAPLHDRVSGMFTPLASAAARLSARAGDGLGGQFAVGALLGGVWGPCVGPTLGAALAR